MLKFTRRFVCALGECSDARNSNLHHVSTRSHQRSAESAAETEDQTTEHCVLEFSIEFFLFST